MKLAFFSTIAIVLVTWLSDPVSAGSDPPGESEVRKRLEALSPDERARIGRNLERWKGLGEEQKEELRRRHEALERLRKEILFELSPRERRRMEGLSPEAYRAELTRRIEERRRNEERRFLRSLPRRQRSSIEGLTGSERARRILELRIAERRRRDASWLEDGVREGRVDPAKASSIRSLGPSDRDRAIERLRQNVLERADRELLRRGVRQGWMTEVQKDRILELDGFDRRVAVSRVRMQRFLENPPPMFERLSKRRRDRLASQPPHRFFHSVRRAMRDELGVDWSGDPEADSRRGPKRGPNRGERGDRGDRSPGRGPNSGTDGVRDGHDRERDAGRNGR